MSDELFNRGARGVAGGGLPALAMDGAGGEGVGGDDGGGPGRARVVAEEVLPALQMDGAGVEVLGVDDGVVRVRLAGTCSGCPATARAVIMGIEEELRRRVPEVDYLEAAP